MQKKGRYLTLKVFLDDMRDCPDGFTLARSYEACLLLLDTQDVDVLSLDHDLGSEKTGYDVCKYVVEKWFLGQSQQPIEIFLHTDNPVGRDNMYQLLSRYKPENVSIYRHKATPKKT